MCISRQYLLPVGILVVFLLAGCGYNGESKGSPPLTGVPATSTTTSPPTSSPPTSPPTSSVALQLGASSYQSSSRISVTIKNQSQQMISFADHRTSCTVLLLERQVTTSWESVAPCKLMIATRIHTLNAGESLLVELAAPSQWPTGTYRARLDYGVGSGSDMPIIVYASEFTVVN
jgi:hypothetical protein